MATLPIRYRCVTAMVCDERASEVSGAFVPWLACAIAHLFQSPEQWSVSKLAFKIPYDTTSSPRIEAAAPETSHLYKLHRQLNGRGLTRDAPYRLEHQFE